MAVDVPHEGNCCWLYIVGNIKVQTFELYLNQNAHTLDGYQPLLLLRIILHFLCNWCDDNNLRVTVACNCVYVC